MDIYDVSDSITGLLCVVWVIINQFMWCQFLNSLRGGFFLDGVGVNCMKYVVLSVEQITTSNVIRDAN